MEKIAKNSLAIAGHMEEEMKRRNLPFTCYALRQDHIKMVRTLHAACSFQF